MADIANLTVRVTAAVGEFKTQMDGAATAVDKFTKEAEVAAKAVAKLSAGFSGDKIISQANAVADAIEHIGGATKLTATEQEKANKTIQEAINKYQALGQEVPPHIQKLGDQFERLAREQKQAADTTESIGLSFGKLVSAAAIGSLLADAIVGLGRAIGNTLKDSIKYADHLTDLSAKAGITTTGLQKLSFATEQSGVSLDSVTQAATKLGAQLVAGDKSVVGGLAKLGLSVTELRKLQPDEMFVKVADAIGKIPDPAEKARRAVEVFGKQGLELLPALTGEMAKTVAEAERLGIVISPATIAAAAKLADQFDILALQGRAFVAEALAPMVPLLSQIVQGISEVAGGVVNQLVAAFSAPAVTQAMTDLREKIAEIFGASTEGRVNDIARAIVRLAEVGATAAEVLVRSFAAVESTILLITIAAARAEQFFATFGSPIKPPDPEAAAAWKAFADELVRVQQNAHDVAKGTGPLIDSIRRVGNVFKTAGDQIGAFNAQVIRPMPSHGPAAPSRLPGAVDADEAALKRLADTAKKTQAELDKLSGQAAINAASQLAQSILKIGGAWAVSRAEAGPAAAVMLAGIKALIEDGQEVPPILREMHLELAIAAARTIDLVGITAKYPPLLKDARLEGERLADVLAAATVGAADILVELPKTVGTSHPDWNKILPPPDFKEWIKRGEEIGDALVNGIFGKLKEGQTRIGAIVGSLAGTIGKQVGEQIGKTLGPALGNVLGKALGPALGKTLGGALSKFLPGLGEIAGQALGGLFDKLFGPSQAKKTAEMRDAFLNAAGGLDELKKQAGDSAAALDALARVQSAKKVKDFEKATKDLEAALKAQEKAIKEQEEALRKFGETLLRVSKSGVLLGKGFIESIAKLDPKGAGGEAVFQFFQEQTERAMKGIETFVTNAKITSQNSATAITASMGAMFADLQLQGLSAAEALQRMGPSILAVTEQLKKAKLEGGPAFQQLSLQAQFAADTVSGPLITAVAGLGDLLVGLGNTGQLNDEIFKGLTLQIVDTWHAIEKAGAGGAAGLRLLQKPLQTVWELWKDQGLAIDDSARGLVEFAEQQGIVGEKFRSTEDKMIKAIETLVERIGKLIDVFAKDLPAGAATGAQQTQDYLDGIRAPTIEVPVVFTYERFDPPTSTGAASVAGAAVIESDIHIDVDGAEIARVTGRNLGRVMAPYGVS